MIAINNPMPTATIGCPIVFNIMAIELSHFISFTKVAVNIKIIGVTIGANDANALGKC